jgi:ribose transport system substrate-binding protein
MVRSCRSARVLGLCSIWTLLALVGCADQKPAGEGGVPAGNGSTTANPAAAAKAPGGVRRIILMTNGNSPFWDAGRAGLEDAQVELKLAEAGLQASLEVNDGTIGGQIAKLRQYNSQTDIAGIAVTAIDSQNVNLAEEMRSLKKKGVAVISFDSDLDREKFRDARTAFIGTDNTLAGKELGRCVQQLVPEGGEYVTFVGLSSAGNAKERIAGFGAGAGAKFKAADAMSDDFDRTKAKENVRNAISNHPNARILAGIYSYNAPAIVDVVKELGKRSEIKILCFDAEPIAIQQMGQGQIDAMIVQNPYQMGYQSVKFLKALITDDQATEKEMFPKLGEPDGDIFDTGLKVVVPNAESPIKNDGFGPKTEYLTLDVFQAWLKKYKLAGS